MVKIKQKNVRGFGFMDRTTFLGVYFWPHSDLLDAGEFQCLEDSSDPETVVLFYQENWLIRWRENWIPILPAINYMCFEQIFSCLLSLCFLYKIQVIRSTLKSSVGWNVTKFVGIPSRTAICQRAGPQICVTGSESLPLGEDFEIYTGKEVLGPIYVKKTMLD